MGLIPGAKVFSIYLTDDGVQNKYREFFLALGPLDEPDTEPDIKIPYELLVQANIDISDDIHNFLVVSSKQSFPLAYRPAGAYIENVFHCRKCKIILFQHDGEKI